MTHLPTIKPLSADEERTLLTLAQAGDRDAEATLALSQVPAIRKLARRVTTQGVDQEDLVTAGLEEYLGRLRTINLNEGVRLWSALNKFVFQAVREEAAATRLASAVPISTVRRYRASMRAAEGNATDARVYATDAARGAERMTPDTWDSVHRLFVADTLWTGGEGTEEDWLNNEDTTPDRQVAEDHALVPFSSVEKRDEVVRLLSTLDDRSKTILGMAYGLVTGEPMTDAAIAAELGLSRPRVANVRLAALASLRDAS